MNVPEGWKLVHARDIAAKNKSAMSTGPFGSSISSKYFLDSGVPVIRGGNLSGKHEIRLIDEGYVYVSEEKALEFKKSTVCAGDLIFTCWGTINQVGLIENDTKYPRYIISNKQMKLTPDESMVSSEYIYSLFSSEQVQRQIASSSIGSSIPGFNLGQLKSIKLLIPPLPEQKKIARILSTWDRAIEVTEKLLNNSQQQKKALMQLLLTGKKRLPGFSGEWESMHLGDVVKIGKGKALSSKDLEKGTYPVIAGGKTSPYNHKDFTHKNVITVSASGAYAGYVAYHECKIWASDCSVVEASKNANICFIFQYMLLKQKKIYSLQSGGAQPHIYPKDLTVLRIKVPALVEQQKIASVLSTADKEIEILEQKLGCLRQEKKALMQQLLTGKRRVKVDEEDISKKEAARA